MFGEYTGHVAGLATSMLWTVTSLCFAAGGRRVGPWVVNSWRIVFAIILHAVTFWSMSGLIFPQANATQITYLALSGFVGLTIGDQALFTAFMYIGPRLSMLVMTIAPLFAAMMGWVFLREAIAPGSMLGIAMTVAGVAWVVLERPTLKAQARPRQYSRGVVMALIGAACQAGGLLLSKMGIGHGWLPESQHIEPQAATYIRLIFAGVGVVPLLVFRHWQMRRWVAASSEPMLIGSPRVGMLFVACGSVVGPFLGVWMSLTAADKLASIGVAQTLCSLTPVLILPMVAIGRQERITLRAVIGAIIAVAGVSILFS